MTDSGSRRYRVAVLNTHPIQYFAPMYAFIDAHLPEVELTALYCSDYSLRGAVDNGFARSVTWDVDLLSGYRYVYLGKAAKTRAPRGFLSLIVPELWNHIRAAGYDALWLHGYGYAACWVGLLAAKSVGMPVMLRGETHLQLSRQGWRRFARDAVLRRVFKSIDAFLTIGSRNSDYYLASGVPPGKIHLVPYAVDNERFEAAATAHREQRADIRTRLGLPMGMPVVLYASKMIERKQPHTLIRAVASLQAAGRDVALCMVGSGPMEQHLRVLANDLGLRNVVFPGFLNQSELPMAFAIADVFVLASTSEPWGLIVNEVMCAGLPVIVSGEMGCSNDLVSDGVNGFQVPAGDIAALAKAIGAIVDNPELGISMGAQSLARIRKWDYAKCADGLKNAIAAIGNRQSQRR